jgi:predicted NUDIX family phosphoesterase
MHLGLVYVVKLRQPGMSDWGNGEARTRFHGMGELQQDRDRFEQWSRIIIDHFVAF